MLGWWSCNSNLLVGKIMFCLIGAQTLLTVIARQDESEGQKNAVRKLVKNKKPA